MANQTCTLGMGCDSACMCYAEAMDQPWQCGRPDYVIVAGTGHRPDKLGGYGLDAVEVLDQALDLGMAEFGFADLGVPDLVISGMALGFDQALARWAIANNVPFVAAIPGSTEQQSSRWGVHARAQYRHLLSKARASVLIPNASTYSRTLDDRNKWMVDTATHLVSLHNGSGGGTGNCVRYANGKIEKDRIFNLWKIWHNLALAKL